MQLASTSALARSALTALATVIAPALLALACGSTGDVGAVPSSSGVGGMVNGGGGALPTHTSTRPTTTEWGSGGASGGAGGASGGSGGAAPGLLGPPYPVVLAHGFFGFEKFAGLGFETYFYGVKQYLAAEGEEVYTPAVDPFNSSDVRGQQLLEHVLSMLSETGYAKVNLVGHSQGGLDARVVAHLRPDLVASVVTVGTPHYGSPVSDVVLKIVSDPNAQAMIDELVKLIGAPIWDQVGDSTSVTKSLAQFSSSGIAVFNQKYTDAPGVLYASVAGRSKLSYGGDDCKPTKKQSWISKFDQTLDPLNPFFTVFEPILAGGLTQYPNDGLVRSKDARWGEFWGCIPADHLDEIGQILGQDPGIGNDFEHKAFYSSLIKYLRVRGY
jgi:triacylglycerol lipase